MRLPSNLHITAASCRLLIDGNWACKLCVISKIQASRLVHKLRWISTSRHRR